MLARSGQPDRAAGAAEMSEATTADELTREVEAWKRGYHSMSEAWRSDGKFYRAQIEGYVEKCAEYRAEIDRLQQVIADLAADNADLNAIIAELDATIKEIDHA